MGDVTKTYSDGALGFEVERIERALLQRARREAPGGDVTSWGKRLHNAQSWVGLAYETLQTPYAELLRMCDLLLIPPNGHFIDLGAAYGRMGVVLRDRFPGARFTGFEIVPERVEEGNRVLSQLGCRAATLVQQDLTAEGFRPPVGDAYLIYDYGTLDHLRHTMEQLAEHSTRQRFQVIARGETIRALIQHGHPWLWDVGPVQHEEKFSVYANYLP